MSQLAKNIKANSGKFWAPDAIFDRRDLNSTQKLILLNLHRRADKNGECHPGQARIAQDCGFKSHATVLRNTPGLIEAGVLKAKRRRSGYRYFLVPHDKWPVSKLDNPPAVTLPEPPKMKLKIKSDVTLGHITKRPKVTQRKTQEGKHKKEDPPTPQTKPTITEHEARPMLTEGKGGEFSKAGSVLGPIMARMSNQHGEVEEIPSPPQPTITDTEHEARDQTDDLVRELEGHGGTFLKTREVIEQFRADGLGEHYLTDALLEMEKTRQKEGVRSVPILLGKKILPRYVEKQTEERVEQQRELARRVAKDQTYRKNWKQAEKERDACIAQYGIPDIATMMKEFKETGQMPDMISKDPSPQLQKAA